MTNIALLETVLTHIQDHPETHDQTEWLCGTSACFAGWAALLSGYQKVHPMTATYVVKSGEDYAPDHVREVAERLLDLSPSDSDVLFSATNTAEDLSLMVKDLSNGERLLDRWYRRSIIIGLRGGLQLYPQRAEDANGWMVFHGPTHRFTRWVRED